MSEHRRKLQRAWYLTGAGVRVARAEVTLRRHGVVHGPLPSMMGRPPLITNRGEIRVGRRFSTSGRQFRASIGTGSNGSLIIGDDVFFNQGSVVHAELSVTIGSRVRIGDLSAVYDTNFHELEAEQGVRLAPVVIEDDVWLARQVVVLPGTTIGTGTVVGAGSVVRGEIPAWVVVSGVPATVVREIKGRGPRS
jgi:acetyltransferase-like isoleucine patch superfamily enzyme